MTAYLGGMEIVGAEMLGPLTVRVRFDSVYGSRFHYQLYVGRSLAGVTEAVTDRFITATVIPSRWPEHIQLLAVEPGERLTDHGADLPPRPYNRVKLGFDTGDWPVGTKSIELIRGTAPGEDPDQATAVRKIFDLPGTQVLITDPLPGTGTWNFEIAGRDGTLPSGNRGTPLALACDIQAHPPDVDLQQDGTRFSVAVEEGVLTVGYLLAE